MEDVLSLQSKDNKVFRVAKKAAILSEMLKDVLEAPPDLQIPLGDIESQTVEKIIEYLTHFNGETPKEIEKPLLSKEMKEITDEWSADFIDKLSTEELANLTAAASYMGIECLLNLCCAKMVSLCKGKSEEEIFKTFNVAPDSFSEEDKEKIREDNKWIDDVFE